MKKLILLFTVLCASMPICSQTVTVHASALEDGGAPARGVIYWAPVLLEGQSASYRKPGGGMSTITPKQATVTNGAFSITLPDTSQTNPINLCFNVTLITAHGSSLGPGFTCLQPAYSNSWCTNGDCVFEDFIPNLAPLAVQVAGPAGPKGDTGPIGPMGVPGIGSDANCHADGSGNLVCGTVAAGASMSAPQVGQNPAVPAAPLSVPNLVGQLQPLHPAALRSLMTRTQAMGLYTSGYPGYSTPSQAIVLAGGDSTTGFHANAFQCTLATQYGTAGYILASPSGTAMSMGYACAGAGYFAPTVAGGASVLSSDFGHFPAGSGWSVPDGGTLTNVVSAVASTRQLVFYTADSAGASITVSVSPDGVTYTPLSSCNGVAVTAGVGGVCDQTITLGTYHLKVSSSGGTIYVWGAGQINTSVNGIVNGNFGYAGTSLPNQASVPTAITQPWFNAIHPDVVTFEMKSNGTSESGGTCNQATTAAPTVFHDRAYWWTRWIGPWLTANPLTDVLYFGSYSISDTDGCIPRWNQYAQQWAYSQNPEQTYVDNYWQLTNSQMQTLGWIGGDVHETALGQAAHSALDLAYLGLLGMPSAVVGQNVNNKQTNTINLSMGALGYVDYNTSFPYYWRFHAQRGFEMYNNAATPVAFARLCDPALGGPCITVDKSFLPPFQLGDETDTSSSGIWFHAHGGQAQVSAAANGGAWKTFAMSAPLFASSTATPTSANATVDVNNSYFVDYPTVDVTGQTYTNGSINTGTDFTWYITQSAAPVNWTWAGTNMVIRGGFRVPKIANARCAAKYRAFSGYGTSAPMTPAVCFVGANAGNGDSRLMVVADAVITGTSSNVDGAGELVINNATSVPYNFEITGYSVHPECWAQPQFDIGSGNRMWITYSGAAQTQMTMTINFATAVTGIVSYGCHPRT